MATSLWWGAPTHIGDSVRLQRMDKFFSDDASTFANAEPLTVRVRGAMVLEKKDKKWRKENDIIIVTKFQFGSDPPVDRLHFMQEDVPLGWEGSFFNPVVLSIRDFNVEKRNLILKIQLYDLDGVPEGLVDAVRGVSKMVAVAFPQLAPYAGVVGFAVPSLLKFVDNLDEHDCILDERLTLELAEPESGSNLLQPGYFACFAKPVEEDLFLNFNLRVLQKDQRSEFRDCSYAVLQVERTFAAHRDWEIDQKVAKLIAELKGKGKTGEVTLKFLRDTLDAKYKFDRLHRARELLETETLTAAEKEFLQELKKDKDLAPFVKGLAQ